MVLPAISSACVCRRIDQAMQASVRNLCIAAPSGCSLDIWGVLCRSRLFFLLMLSTWKRRGKSLGVGFWGRVGPRIESNREMVCLPLHVQQLVCADGVVIVSYV
jgi:hypothetical protein